MKATLIYARRCVGTRAGMARHVGLQEVGRGGGMCGGRHLVVHQTRGVNGLFLQLRIEEDGGVDGRALVPLAAGQELSIKGLVVSAGGALAEEVLAVNVAALGAELGAGLVGGQALSLEEGVVGDVGLVGELLLAGRRQVALAGGGRVEGREGAVVGRQRVGIQTEAGDILVALMGRRGGVRAYMRLMALGGRAVAARVVHDVDVSFPGVSHARSDHGRRTWRRRARDAEVVRSTARRELTRGEEGWMDSRADGG